MIQNINWYPGHMKKTRELIKENLKAVDIVIEVVDARIPLSSRNPIIDDILQDKPRILALNKMDLADPIQNRAWVDKLTDKQNKAMLINAMNGKGLKELERYLVQEETKKNEEKARKRHFRIMIVGVPNVGKSSLINRMTGKKSTQVGNRPGVTKGKQWLTLKNGMQLLDTPGILWPKFEDPNVGLNLAFCGSIKDEILDSAELGFQLITFLQKEYPVLLEERYKLEAVSENPLDTMENIARNRGFILPGKKIDYERCARAVIDEFRSGKLGKITLEKGM